MINAIKNADKVNYIRCQWRVWKQNKQVYFDVLSKNKGQNCNTKTAIYSTVQIAANSRKKCKL